MTATSCPPGSAKLLTHLMAQEDTMRTIWDVIAEADIRQEGGDHGASLI